MGWGGTQTFEEEALRHEASSARVGKVVNWIQPLPGKGTAAAAVKQ